MLTDLGQVSVDIQPLIDVVEGFSPRDWMFRGDPESNTTRVVRENTTAFPRQLVEPIIGAIGEAAFGKGYFNGMVFSCVPAGKWILPHSDDFGERVKVSHHCHLPLITHPEAVLGIEIDGKMTEVHMEAGHLYVMDASKRHYVVNPSKVDRIHLLFTYFPEGGIWNLKRT